MKRSRGVALVATTLALCAWMVIASTPGAPPPSAHEAGGEPTPLAPVVSDVDATSADPVQRQLVAPLSPPSPADIDLRHPFEFRLRCRVLDSMGMPVPGAKIAFAPMDCAMNGWPPHLQDEVGELRWRGKVETMTVAVGVIDRSLALRRVQVTAGQRQECLLLKNVGGTPTACRRGKPPGVMRCGDCHGAIVPADDCRLEVQRGVHPESTLGDVLLAVPPGPDHFIASTTSWESVSGGSSWYGHVSTGTITGVVFGADGRRAAFQDVCWYLQPGSPLGGTRTDAEGRYRLRDVLSQGNVTIRAGGCSEGLGFATPLVRDQQETACDLRLDRGNVQRGRAVSSDGAPLTRWHVEFQSADGRWADADDVYADGSYALANQPAVPGTLLLWSGDGHRLPMAMADVALAGERDVVFDFRERPMPTSVLRFSPVLPKGLDDEEVSAFVWQLDSGRGVRLAKGIDGAFAIGGLRAGGYRVSVGCAGCGFVDLGTIQLDGSNPVDLGAVTLPEPGRLWLLHRPSEGFELFLRRREYDARAEPTLNLDCVVLPPGDWLALWRESGVVQRRAFTVAPGSETLLDFASAPR